MAFSGFLQHQDSAKTKLYDVRTISGDWPQSVFGITWVYALTYIRNLLDDYMATALPEGSSHKKNSQYNVEFKVL